MGTAALLEIILAGLNNAAALSAIFQTATAEKRDLTPEEVAMVRAKAVGSIDALQAKIDAMP